jgi:hypothetical protein
MAAAILLHTATVDAAVEAGVRRPASGVRRLPGRAAKSFRVRV